MYLPGLRTFAINNRMTSGVANQNISVTAESGGFKVSTPYNAQFVAELKTQIPASARKWDNAQKVWFVARGYGAQLKQIIDAAYGSSVVLPIIIAPIAEIFETTFKADYVANCKTDAASVWANGGWNARIPEKVLRQWFKQIETDTGNATFYGLLGLEQSCTSEDVKRAYKRAARQWHPDLCREENAREMFERIKSAHDVLSNIETRSKYNAGLFFERMAKTGASSQKYGAPKIYKSVSFTPMLRCGELKVRAKSELGLLIVEEILEWNDVQNEIGQTMVSFWSDNSFSVVWV